MLMSNYPLSSDEIRPSPIFSGWKENGAFGQPVCKCDCMFIVSVVFFYLNKLPNGRLLMAGILFITCDLFATTGNICLKSPARKRVALPIASLLDRRSFGVTSSASRETLHDMVALFHTINLQLAKRAVSSEP